MDESLPTIYLARHGETAWTVSGQHTGLTDLPLTPAGEAGAKELGERLAGMTFSLVLTSPLQRASRTCLLAGFDALAQVDHDLVEWDYGAYEGLRSPDIRAKNPNWNLFRDGAPGGETPDQVVGRAKRVLQRARDAGGDVLFFSSGHFLRVVAAAWIGVDPALICRQLMLSTASLSALGYEHNRSRPVIQLWNETRVPAKPGGMPR
jgi:probable phosphoglycerate mutase